jgi:hypothetical protein
MNKTCAKSIAHTFKLYKFVCAFSNMTKFMKLKMAVELQKHHDDVGFTVETHFPSLNSVLFVSQMLALSDVMSTIKTHFPSLNSVLVVSQTLILFETSNSSAHVTLRLKFFFLMLGGEHEMRSIDTISQ